MMREIYEFLRELRENNDRDWFNANKERYLKLKAEFEVFVGEVLKELALFDPEMKGIAVKDCVYRIYRDTRFSPNKTPYKIHFAAYMAAFRGKNSDRAGYYMHIEPDGSLLGGGLYCPDSVLLKRLRQDIYDNMEEFSSILQHKEFAGEFPGLDGTDMLKKVPAPFPADAPGAEFLRHKHYDVVSYKPDSFFEEADAKERIIEVFKRMQPFNRFLNYTVDGEGL